MLGVDTAVVVDGEALGKPADAAEAEAMLERLSGRTHEVVSGPLLGHAGLGGARSTRRRGSRSVPLTARDLAHYVGSGEWEDRAGGYAIQGLGARARRADRGRLPERRRPPGSPPRPPPRRTLPGNVRLRLIQPCPGDCPLDTFGEDTSSPVIDEDFVGGSGLVDVPSEQPEHHVDRDETRAQRVLSGRGSSTTATRPDGGRSVLAPGSAAGSA